MDALAEHVLSLRERGFNVHLVSSQIKGRPVGVLVEDLEARTDGSGKRLLKVLADAFKRAGLKAHVVFRPYDDDELKKLKREPREAALVQGRLSVFSTEAFDHYPDETEQERIRQLHRLIKRGLKSAGSE